MNVYKYGCKDLFLEGMLIDWNNFSSVLIVTYSWTVDFGSLRFSIFILLLFFFLLQYGRESIEKNQRRRGSESEDEDEDQPDEINYRADEIQKPVTVKRNGITGSKNNGTSKIANGYVNNHSNVISREDFILLPEPESVVSNKTTENAHSEEVNKIK